MTQISRTSPKSFLGASIPNTKVLSSEIDQIIDRVNNPETPIVDATSATLTLTSENSGSTVVLDRAAGVTVTLPDASTENIGVFYDFIVETTVTSNAYVINTAKAADLYVGGVSFIDDTTPESATMFKPDVSNDDAMSMNGTTTGGKIGCDFRIKCIGVNKWYVSGIVAASGVIATPFA